MERSVSLKPLKSLYYEVSGTEDLTSAARGLCSMNCEGFVKFSEQNGGQALLFESSTLLFY